MSNEIAVRGNGHGALAAVAGYEAEQLDLIKKTVAVGATDLELQMFLTYAKRTGLDPIGRQIHCIKRGDKATIQVSIDGLRLIADRTGAYCGNDRPVFEGVTADGNPAIAYVTVYKFVQGTRCAFAGEARWDEYAQKFRARNGEGEYYGDLWRRGTITSWTRRSGRPAIDVRRCAVIYYAADLYCGGGELTTALLQAAREAGHEVDLVAVNHWDTAIETHSLNHPGVRHILSTVETVRPLTAVPGGHLDLLLAAPSCTHYSNARGGRPMSDQMRAAPWHILWWCQELHVQNVLIENVPELRTWGPLYPDNHPDEKRRGKPIPEQKGSYYRLFLRNLRALGYTVQDRVLNCAHYGDATTRERLFIQARKGKRRITWPSPSHLPPAELDAYPGAQPWRSAREIIDWSLQGESIYTRKKPLAPNTMARIAAGLQKFSGLPFVIGQQSDAAPRGTDAPLPTIAGAGAISLVRPFLVVLRNHADARSLEDPVPTVSAQGTHLALCAPFLMVNRTNNAPKCLEDPVPTICTGPHMALCEPCIIPVTHAGGPDRSRSIDAPLPTITTANRGELALVDPFLVPQFGERDGQAPRTHSVDAPLPAVTSHGAGALVEPFLVNMKGRSDACDIDKPAPTITAHAEHLYLAEPFIVGAGGPEGAGRPASVADPLGTIMAENHRALAEPYIVTYHGHHAGQRDGDTRTHSVDEPLRTLDASNRAGLARPFLVQYHGSDRGAHSVDDPLPTVDTRDRYALVQPELYAADMGEVIGYLDIRFRMLQPHELAAATSFPPDYQFAGTKDAQVKQVGNAVPVRTGTALCRAILRDVHKANAQ